jgi:F-type H+-transporting ATPase subunit b
MTKRRGEFFWFIIILLVVLSLVGVVCLAEEGAEAVQAPGIPKIVFYQAINFFGLLAILYYFLHKKVAAHFVKRHDDLTLQLREAKKLKDDAEVKHQEYLVKIKNLESEADQILTQIKLEGEASKNRIVAEAKALAEAIQIEAKKSAANEVQKAKAELYDEVLAQSLEGARTLLTKSVVDKDQLRLQKEFVEKIEAVQ